MELCRSTEKQPSLRTKPCGRTDLEVGEDETNMRPGRSVDMGREVIGPTTSGGTWVHGERPVQPLVTEPRKKMLRRVLRTV